MATFEDKTIGSAEAINSVIDELMVSGQASIDELVASRENTLIQFNNKLVVLNNKKIQSNRIGEIGVPAKFLVTDFQDINQSRTTASIRADVGGVSLQERREPTEATINKITFSTSVGTADVLNQVVADKSGLKLLYKVMADTVPTGIFNIQLNEALGSSLILFDIIDSPADPDIKAFVSTNGISYVEAKSVNKYGYRLAAIFDPQEVKYIRLQISPSLPDILGGSIYTFGLTDIHVLSAQFHRRSDFYSKTINMASESDKLKFVCDSDPGLTYFLSFNSTSPISVSNGSIINVPSTERIILTHVSMDTVGKLGFTLPSDVYLSTVEVRYTSSGTAIMLAPDLSHLTTGLSNKYITIDSSGNMYFIVYNHLADAGKEFNITCSRGPSSFTVQLQVILTTDNINETPVFRGARLEEV